MITVQQLVLNFKYTILAGQLQKKRASIIAEVYMFYIETILD